MQNAEWQKGSEKDKGVLLNCGGWGSNQQGRAAGFKRDVSTKA